MLLSCGCFALPECRKSGHEHCMQEGCVCGSLVGNVRMGSPAGSTSSGLCPVDGVEFLVHTNLGRGQFWAYQNRWSIGIRTFLQVTKGKFGIEMENSELVRAVGSDIPLST